MLFCCMRVRERDRENKEKVDTKRWTRKDHKKLLPSILSQESEQIIEILSI